MLSTKSVFKLVFVLSNYETCTFPFKWNLDSSYIRVIKANKIIIKLIKSVLTVSPQFLQNLCQNLDLESGGLVLKNKHNNPAMKLKWGLEWKRSDQQIYNAHPKKVCLFLSADVLSKLFTLRRDNTIQGDHLIKQAAKLSTHMNSEQEESIFTMV